MPTYVDGFVIPLPKKNLAAYKKMARGGARVWKKHGALQYFECVGDDLASKYGLPFPKGIRTKPSETIVFAFIVYKSKKHRDEVNAKVMGDPLMGKIPKRMPFDPKRMMFGGFKTIVEA